MKVRKMTTKTRLPNAPARDARPGTRSPTRPCTANASSSSPTASSRPHRPRQALRRDSQRPRHSLVAPGTPARRGHQATLPPPLPDGRGSAGLDQGGYLGRCCGNGETDENKPRAALADLLMPVLHPSHAPGSATPPSTPFSPSTSRSGPSSLDPGTGGRARPTCQTTSSWSLRTAS